MAAYLAESTEYQYGFHDDNRPVFKAKRGLSCEVVEEISYMKNEPDWMRKFRLRALEMFERRPMPNWGSPALADLDFATIYYYLKPSEGQSRSWDDVPSEIKNTFDRLGIPEAEKKFLAGVGAQYESEVVYHNIRTDLEKQGVIFCGTDEAVHQYPELMHKYFGKIIPPNDNKFAALHSAVWSGGSFIYVPENVHVELPLQAYFRINAENMGQFERTLIICAPGSYVHYVEGCTAPTYSTDSLHSAVVEIVVEKGARCRYTTIQNWSKNVYNLVTKRAAAYQDATMEWVDGNLGSRLTMKYPSVFMMEPGAIGAKSSVRCDALLLDEHSRTDTYPYIEVEEDRKVATAHEASVSKVGEDQLFYLMSRGLDEVEATSMIVRGFIEPIAKELPLEYALELNRLIQLEMEGSVG